MAPFNARAVLGNGDPASKRASHRLAVAYNAASDEKLPKALCWLAPWTCFQNGVITNNTLAGNRNTTDVSANRAADIFNINNFTTTMNEYHNENPTSTTAIEILSIPTNIPSNVMEALLPKCSDINRVAGELCINDIGEVVAYHAHETEHVPMAVEDFDVVAAAAGDQ